MVNEYYETREILSEGQEKYVSEHAEAKARHAARHIDRYVAGLIKKKPWWIPEGIYRKLMREMFELAFFESAKKGQYEYLGMLFGNQIYLKDPDERAVEKITKWLSGRGYEL